jgi:hypothetical protein
MLMTTDRRPQHRNTVHLTVTVPKDVWDGIRKRYPNRKASHIVTTALRAWLTAHPQTESD